MQQIPFVSRHLPGWPWMSHKVKVERQVAGVIEVLFDYGMHVSHRLDLSSSSPLKVHKHDDILRKNVLLWNCYSIATDNMI